MLDFTHDRREDGDGSHDRKAATTASALYNFIPSAVEEVGACVACTSALLTLKLLSARFGAIAEHEGKVAALEDFCHLFDKLVEKHEVPSADLVEALARQQKGKE